VSFLFQLSLPFGQVKLPLAVKLLCSEVCYASDGGQTELHFVR